MLCLGLKAKIFGLAPEAQLAQPNLDPVSSDLINITTTYRNTAEILSPVLNLPLVGQYNLLV